MKIGAYLYCSKNEEAKSRSSSGAAFFELASNAIKKGYYVAGCVWNQNLKAEHIISNRYSDLVRMQGSKYVQSDVKDTFKEMIALLKNDEKVLFSGTPCQAVAAGKIATLIGKRHNLISISIICHGVPSPLAWRKYIEWDEKKQNSKLINVNFRDKEKKGYEETYSRYEYGGGKIIFKPTYLPENKYIETGIVYNLSMRECCADCKAKGINTNIDIVIGDWHEAYMDKGRMGTSCIVCYTTLGLEYVYGALDEVEEISFESVVEKNKNIIHSSYINPKSESFFKMINGSNNWDKIEKLYPMKYSLKKILYKMGIYKIIKRKVH